VVNTNQMYVFSRAVEHNLDREDMIFSIEVFKCWCFLSFEFSQTVFIKNLGRDLQS